MLVPSQAQLLDLWDAGSRSSPWCRAALLLQCAWPDAAVAQWPLGLVNARLLQLRAALFGSDWNCLADCPACAKVAEVRLDISAMLVGAQRDEPLQEPAWHVVDEPSVATRFRLPVLGDLASSGAGNAQSAARLLDAIVAAPGSNACDTVPAEVLPRTRAEIERQLLRLDPLAAIDIVMDCPACGHRWRSAAEVIGMLWAEVSVLARRMLADVARLASLFGWSEPQILALSSTRRQHYLDMVREW